MAVGLGKMFGFEFKENFHYPYCARSVTEFWRRWHISLSSWFREYVYIPLGGNRVSVPRHMLNLLIVWTLTGLWHGASWNFVVWGALLRRSADCGEISAAQSDGKTAADWKCVYDAAGSCWLGILFQPYLKFCHRVSAGYVRPDGQPPYG